MPDTAKVIPITDDTPVQKVIATGFSLVVNLAGERQITFQSGYEGDEDDASINARLDRMMAFADRQKAIYQIPEIEDELFKHRETLANFIEDRDRIEANHVKAQAEREAQIAALDGELRAEAVADAKEKVNVEILHAQDLRNAEIKRGQEDWQKHGKLGAYKPAGAVKANVDRCNEAIERYEKLRDEEVERVNAETDALITKIRAEIVKAENEREQALANLGISINRYQEAIAERETRLAKCRATAGG